MVAACGSGVKHRQKARKCIEAWPDVGAGVHERREAAVLGHAPHLDRAVDHFAAVARDVDDTEVDVGREPAIERDLALTYCAPAFRGRLVDEREPYGLLELVNPLAAERNDRHVRLPELDAGVAGPGARPPLELGAGHGRRAGRLAARHGTIVVRDTRPGRCRSSPVRGPIGPGRCGAAPARLDVKQLPSSAKED